MYTVQLYTDGKSSLLPKEIAMRKSLFRGDVITKFLFQVFLYYTVSTFQEHISIPHGLMK